MATQKKATKPEPVAVSTVCSLCGLDWKGHGRNPTTVDCIRLLKKELANQPISVPRPYPLPYPVPYPRPYREPWYGERPYYGVSKIDCGTTTHNETTQTPALAEIAPKAVSHL
jgi:hypothetical protein